MSNFGENLLVKKILEVLLSNARLRMKNSSLALDEFELSITIEMLMEKSSK